LPRTKIFADNRNSVANRKTAANKKLLQSGNLPQAKLSPEVEKTAEIREFQACFARKDEKLPGAWKNHRPFDRWLKQSILFLLRFFCGKSAFNCEARLFYAMIRNSSGDYPCSCAFCNGKPPVIGLP